MPIFESKCDKCGTIHEYVRPVSQYLDTPDCCGQKTVKGIFTAPYGLVDIPAYVSPVSGRLINSRSERKEDLKRTGSRPQRSTFQRKVMVVKGRYEWCWARGDPIGCPDE